MDANSPVPEILTDDVEAREYVLDTVSAMMAFAANESGNELAWRGEADRWLSLYCSERGGFTLSTPADFVAIIIPWQDECRKSGSFFPITKGN